MSDDSEAPELDLLVDRDEADDVRRVLELEGAASPSVTDTVVRMRVPLARGEGRTAKLKKLHTAREPHRSTPAFGTNLSVSLQADGLPQPQDSALPKPQDSAGEGVPISVRARTVKREGRRGRGITVGVIDTRVAPHRYLFGAVLAEPRDVLETTHDIDLNSDGRPDSKVGHGTFVAGLILQQAPDVTVRLKRVLTNAGRAPTTKVIEAAKALAAQKIDVLNLSLGAYVDDDDTPFGLIAALREINPEIVVVAAAGNLPERHDGNGGDPHGRPFFPAAIPGVVAVAAAEPTSETEWQLAKFSNSGPWLTFAAPGVDVESTFITFKPKERSKDNPAFEGWASWSGTSFAAAIVSGQIAATMSEKKLTARGAVRYLLDKAPLPTVDVGGKEIPVIEQSGAGVTSRVTGRAGVRGSVDRTGAPAGSARPG